ncbi:MAG: hypothetical protein A2X78_01905 [Gammaproteobacteria bacterium GWE2_37_16]|nr:MAG: hypothetical protein A2X78_01905 [Gammaproteobacteria bacterium GWE2_37_16]
MPTHLEYALISQHVYGSYPSLLFWQQIRIMRNDKNGFFSAAYLNDNKKEIVIAFRGTANMQNIITDFGLALAKVPNTLQEAIQFIREINQLKEQHFTNYTISLTGHSLGAVLAELCTCCIDGLHFRAVTFESPGIGKLLIADKQHSAKDLITGYVTAPNAINTMDSHFGKLFRLFVPHTGGLGFWHVAGCIWGTANRFTLFYSVGGKVLKAAVEAAETVGKAAAFARFTAEAVHIGVHNAAVEATETMGKATAFIAKNAIMTSKETSINTGATAVKQLVSYFGGTTLNAAAATTTAVDAATIAAVEIAAATAVIASGNTITKIITGNVARQVVPTVQWLIRQHSIDNIVSQFDLNTGNPKKVAHIVLWPHGLKKNAIDFISSMGRDFIPLHPRNRGLHTLFNENGMLEHRIEAIKEYRIEAMETFASSDSNLSNSSFLATSSLFRIPPSTFANTTANITTLSDDDVYKEGYIGDEKKEFDLGFTA